MPHGTPLLRIPVARGDSWWLYARRHALSYAELAALNGLPVADVRAGRALVAGRAVFVADRTGLARKAPLRFCGAPVSAAQDPRWRVYPDLALWRAPLRPVPPPGGADSVPALLDPHAFWIPDPSKRSLGAWADRYGLTLDALLAYNGYPADAASPDTVPSAHLAVPSPP